MRAALASLGLVGVVGLATCYRDPVRPAVGNASDPALAAEDPACKRADDLDQDLDDVFPEGRLRSHQSGVLSGANARTWKSIPIPTYIPPRVGTLELFLLDQADGGYLAFYREPYNLTSCTLGDARNCSYQVDFYDRPGAARWSVPLNPLLSRPRGLEIQDIRLADGVLLFNEACQSYAAEQGGHCSSLVAVDPRTRTVLWRTPPLVSNGRFAVRGCYVVAGYGFTAEPDFLHLVERATGKVVQKLAVSSAPQQYANVNAQRLDVTLYSGVLRRYQLERIATHAGRIVELDAPEPGLADGAGYGGAGYGGATYGGYGVGGATYGGATYGVGGATYGGATYGAPVPRKH